MTSPAVTTTALGLDPDALAACVSCGLCLAYCPTYRVTGEEGLSPRGRIAAMRAVEAGAPIDDSFERLMETCVQCRACETACPSSVRFGRLMEGTRGAIAPRSVSAWQRAAYWVLGRPRLLQSLTTVGALTQRAGLIPRSITRRLALPRLPVRQTPLRPPRRGASDSPGGASDTVWLFTGCVMDAWQRHVHRDAVSVLADMGADVVLPERGAACCGALHLHAGLESSARQLARRVMAAFPGAAPILVDSAGCGAALEDYGHLLGTAEAHAFARRVLDIHEWMASRPRALPPPVPGWRRPRVAVQDPCHLRHVQRAERHVRTVLEPYADLVELTDEGRCCGAGGAYSALQPELAGAIRVQKLAAIDDIGADEVVSANPGCSLWLGAAGVRIRHPIELVAQASGRSRG